MTTRKAPIEIVCDIVEHRLFDGEKFKHDSYEAIKTYDPEYWARKNCDLKSHIIRSDAKRILFREVLVPDRRDEIIRIAKGALKFYSDRKKWDTITLEHGNVFNAQDGDEITCFDEDDRTCYGKAIEALASIEELEKVE